jgi:hypothetical protein
MTNGLVDPQSQPRLHPTHDVPRHEGDLDRQVERNRLTANVRLSVPRDRHAVRQGVLQDHLARQRVDSGGVRCGNVHGPPPSTQASRADPTRSACRPRTRTGQCSSTSRSRRSAVGLLSPTSPDGCAKPQSPTRGTEPVVDRFDRRHRCVRRSGSRRAVARRGVRAGGSRRQS